MGRIFFGILAFSISASAWGFFDCVKGSLDPIVKAKSLAGVKRVYVEASIDLVIRKGDKERLVLNGPKDLLDNLVVEQKGERLLIGSEKCADNQDSVKMVAYLKDLSEVGIEGSSDIVIKDMFSSEHMTLTIAGSGDISGHFEAEQLTAAIRGSGDIKLKGKSQKLQVDILGSGDVSFEEFAASRVAVTIKGAGDVKVHASEFLDVKIYGSGDVGYKGRPKVAIAKYGSGSIRPL